MPKNKNINEFSEKLSKSLDQGASDREANAKRRNSNLSSMDLEGQLQEATAKLNQLKAHRASKLSDAQAASLQGQANALQQAQGAMHQAPPALASAPPRITDEQAQRLQRQGDEMMQQVAPPPPAPVGMQAGDPLQEEADKLKAQQLAMYQSPNAVRGY